MRFLSCVVAAEEDEALAVAHSESPLDEWSGFESPGLDTVRLAALHALLTDDPLSVALDLYEPVCVIGEDEEIVVLRIDAALFGALAALEEEDIETLAEDLAATEAYEEDEAEVDDVHAFLSELADLAQLAESQDQLLFVRIGLQLD